MSKENEEIIDNPFKNFSLLDTNLSPEPKNEQGEPGKTEKTKDTSGSQEDEAAKAAAEKEAEVEAKLAEVAKKQAEAASKKTKVESKEEEDEEEEEPKQDLEEDSTLKPFVLAMAEKGIVDFNEEEFKDDDFSDESVIEKVIGKTIQKGVEDWKKSYPEETQAFLTFVENGGDPKQFLNIYYNNHSWEDFKIDDESAQEVTVREGLKLAGYEDAEIQEEIDLYKDSGKLEAKATQHLAKLKKYEAGAKKELIEQQAAYNKQREEEARNHYENLKKTWYDKEDLNGFKLNKVTKDKVWDFIYTPDKKTGLTGLQKSYQDNLDAQFMYAYLAMNNFDIGKLEKIVESKVTSKVRKTLSNYTDQRFKTTRGVSEREDKVDEGGAKGFGAFKRIL